MALPPFADLLREHQSMVWSVARHSLGDAALAEEIAQDVFLKLHQSLDQMESVEHVRNWLRRATLHRCIDEARRRRLRPRVSLEEAPEPRAAFRERDPLLARRVRDEIAQLPAHARAVVVLRYQEEMEPTQIAELLQLPVNTVKTRLHRALRSLRERLDRPAGLPSSDALRSSA